MALHFAALEAEQCTLEQFNMLRALEERLKLIEAAVKLHEMNQQQQTTVTSTKSKVLSFNANETSKVATLKSKFEINRNSGGRVKSMVSRLLGKTSSRPPLRPMTLARDAIREGVSAG